MVTLNTNNTAIPIIPNSKTSGFSLEPDWISVRDELTDSYKRFYSLVMRRVGSRGFSFLSIGKLAQDLKLSTRTISNHIKTSRKFNLMQVVPTGRSSLFVILWHPWMPITKDQADQIRSESCLSEKIANLISKSFKSSSPQTKENQVVSNHSKKVETIFKEPIKDLRGHSQPASASTFAHTEEKTQNVAAPRKENADKPKKPKGKFSLEIYLDFARSEQKEKKNIKKLDKFADWLLREGKQDKEVGRFVETMKENLIGSRPSDEVKENLLPSPSPSPVAAQPQRLEDLEEIKRGVAIEKYGNEIWGKFTEAQKNKIIAAKQNELLKTKPQIYAQMPKFTFDKHVEGLVKHEMGEVRYRLNG